jgi:cell division protein FtsL
VVLRYFKNHDFRTVGRALELSDDAAQKRVSRAVERLREFFSKRGVTIGASGLVVLISANAVHAAPLALISTISTAILAGATIHTSTAAVATKAIAMTLIQKTLVTATVIVIAGAGIHQAHQAAQLRDEVQTLQQQQAPLAAQIQQLQQERDDATNQVASLSEEITKARASNVELLRLRREVDALPQRQRSTAAQPIAIGQSVAENFQLPDEVNQIAQAVAQGDPTALQRLTDYSKSQHQFFNTNQVGLTNEQLSALSSQAFGGLRTAFDFLAAEAVKGNPNARQAIDQAVRSGYLEGTAVAALGKLAENGDEAALQTLLNYDQNGIPLSSAVGALSGPAGNGNEPAIAVLAAVLKDDSKKPLWFMASNGLEKAASSGNLVALDAIKFRSQPQ